MNPSNSTITKQRSSRATSSKIVASEIADPGKTAAQRNIEKLQAGQFRIDVANSSRGPHYRAQQLEEFTSWLSQNYEMKKPDADQEQTPQDSSLRINKLFRVDAHGAQTEVKPHFKTENYLAPVSETTNAIPTDGFDPLSGIRTDLAAQQDTKPTTIDHSKFIASWQVPGFNWPEITTQLNNESSGAIRTLCNSTTGMMLGTGNRLMITAAESGVGNSTIAMSLARQYAASGKRTLLVDGNIADPNLGIRMGLQPSISWVQAVSQRRSINEVVIESVADRLHFMPLCPITSSVSWPRKIYDQLGHLLFQLQSEFDLILIDGGKSTQVIAEASTPHSIADSFLLVSSKYRIATPALHTAQRGLTSFGARRMLIAQNFMSPTTSATKTRPTAAAAVAG